MNNTTSFNYSGAHVLVTGGTSGIGNGIANAFVDAGATVTITGTRASTADYDIDLSPFHYQQLEVQDKSAIYDFAPSLPALDILINNAGASLPGGKDEWDPDVFETSIQINLLSAYHMSYACRELLANSALKGGANIISIASLTSFFGLSIVPAYGAAKAGLVQLSKTLACTWAEKGIRVNAIAAGLIETRMTGPMVSIPELSQPILERTPLKRFGTPEDISGLTLFLCSDMASFITGQAYLVDGGFSAQG